MQALLTGSQVAKILNISRSQAFSLMQQGEIPTVRIGQKCVRVTMEDLESYVESMRVPANHSDPNDKTAVTEADSETFIIPTKRSNYVH